MPVSYSSPARNLFLLGTTGQDVVTNFFDKIDRSSSGYFSFLPVEVIKNNVDEEILIGLNADEVSPSQRNFGIIEKRLENGTQEWETFVSATNPVYQQAFLRDIHLDSNNNIIACGDANGFPWIAKYSNGGVVDWQSTSSSGNVRYRGVTSDSNGQYYACGNTPTSGEAQAFVEKFDASGNPGWGKSAFMLGRDVVLSDIAANDRGHVVAVGYLEDDSADKAYIIKIDTNTGEVLWDRTLSKSVSVRALAITIDDADEIYIAGVSGTEDVNTDGFIVKYTAEGNMLWQSETDIGSTTNDWIVFSDIAVDNSSKKASIGGYTSAGAIVISRYESDGRLSWRREAYQVIAGHQYTSIDVDQSFTYFLFDDGLNQYDYTFGKVSATGNGLGDFEYNNGDGSGIPIQYVPTTSQNGTNITEKIGRLSDGSVRNDTSDLITYPFSANKLLFDDLATQVSNKRRQMDSADSFEYSGSPAIRPVDFQELNLLGDVYSGSGDWLDQSGKGNDGVVNGATHNAAGYWEFDGVDDKVTISRNDFTSSGNIDFSIESWFYFDSLPTLPTSKGYIWDQSPGASGVAFRASTAGDLTTFAYPSGGGGVVLANSGVTLQTGRWYHAVSVFETNKVSLYVDGELSNVTNATIASVAPVGETDFFIGSAADGGNGNGSEFMDGRIGEVRIYPRALTAAQVFQNYNATKSKYINEAPDTAPKIGPGIVYDNFLFLNYDFGNRATYDRVENVLKYSNNFDKWSTDGNNPQYMGKIGPNGEDVWQFDLIQKSGASQEGEASFQQLISPAYPAGTVTSQRWLMRSAPGYGTQTVYHKHGRNAVYSANQANVEFDITEEWSEITTTDSVFTGNTKAFFGIGTVNAGVVVQIAKAQLWIGSENARYVDTYGVRLTAPTTVKNLSSTFYTGTINGGTTFNPDGYFSFGGVSADYIEPTITIPATARSYFIWIRYNSITNLTNGYSLTGCQEINAYTYLGIEENDANGAYFYYYIGNQGQAMTGTLLQTNTWYQQGVVMNADGTRDLYLNGSNIGTVSSGAIGNANTQTFRLGKVNDNHFVDGDMGGVLLYTRALSATEISQNFNATRSKYGV